ncbi:hypothetical protein BZA05DRAFT_149700 [Tricharina praecox]|uniref:uncharacterized protein n=1 Tax=Tricharina praecox TaxID=43433 RepID=UPI00221FEE55|nr:uncharacterized protein BZA05DRAFT_149700 [Tricharina praecox]KAI5845406.1 hypothetical protein BZA05DRAFT_149700 [Tricharina praecox]
MYRKICGRRRIPLLASLSHLEWEIRGGESKEESPRLRHRPDHSLERFNPSRLGKCLRAKKTRRASGRATGKPWLSSSPESVVGLLAGAALLRRGWGGKKIPTREEAVGTGARPLEVGIRAPTGFCVCGLCPWGETTCTECGHGGFFFAAEERTPERITDTYKRQVAAAVLPSITTAPDMSDIPTSGGSENETISEPPIYNGGKATMDAHKTILAPTPQLTDDSTTETWNSLASDAATHHL